jgi:hypothetical protein
MTITENLTSVQESQFLKMVTSNLVPVEIIKEKKGVATLIKCNGQALLKRYLIGRIRHIQ